MQTQTVTSLAVIPATETLAVHAADPALTHPPQSGVVVTTAPSKIQPTVDVVCPDSFRGTPVPVSHEHLPIPTLSLGMTALTQTIPRATLHETNTPAVDATLQESNTRDTSGEAVEMSRTTAESPRSAGPPEPPLVTSPVVGPVPQSADSSAGPPSDDAPIADSCGANPPRSDPRADFPRADLSSADPRRADSPSADPSADSRRADEYSGADENPRTGEEHRTHEHRGPAGDGPPQGSDEVERGPLSSSSTIPGNVGGDTAHAGGSGPQTRGVGVDGGNSFSVAEIQVIERGG